MHDLAIPVFLAERREEDVDACHKPGYAAGR